MQNAMEGATVNKNGTPAFNDTAQMREAYRCIATLGKVVAVLVSRLRCHVSRPRAAPEAFAVAGATGICRRCAEKRDGALLQKLVQRMREHYPDLTSSSVATRGHCVDTAWPRGHKKTGWGVHAATLCPRMLGAVDTR